MLQHTGTCHLSKSKPQIGKSITGEWAVILRVLDVIGTHQKESWLVQYRGEQARAWWDREGRTLEPGDTLRVVLERARVHVIGRERHTATAEVHAHMVQCELVARAKRAQD